MKEPLKKDHLISLYLSRVCPINEIRYKIIKMALKKENEETLEYHTDRWENIAGSYYMIINSLSVRKLSYVFGTTYIIRIDLKLDFYNLTRISYQVIDLIHGLIRLKKDDHASYKEILYNDDKLYSELSKKIMTRMRWSSAFRY